MMDFFYVFLRLSYVLVFFIAVFISLKFEWSSEGKDERGRTIANKSYGVVFPLLPLGWLLIELYHDYVAEISYSTYKLLIWFLLTGLLIIHAINITVLKRKL